MLLFCLTSYASKWERPRQQWFNVNTDAIRVATPLWRDELGPRKSLWASENWQVIHVVEAPTLSSPLLCRVLNGKQWKMGYVLTRVWNRDAIPDALLEDKPTERLLRYVGLAAKIQASRLFTGTPEPASDDGDWTVEP